MRRCEGCERPLSNPRSIELGYGPGCWSRLDVADRFAVVAALPTHDPPADEVASAMPTLSAALSATPARSTTTVTGPSPTATSQPAPAPEPPGSTGPAPATPAAPHPPRRPQRSASSLAMLTSWITAILLLAALVLFWRWVLAGLGVVAAMAVAGLLLERLDERVRVVSTRPARPRRATRELERSPSRLRSTTVSTSPGG